MTERSSAMRKVCILTGGGDAPGLNPVLRGFVKASAQLGIETWGSEDGFDGLISDRLRQLTPESVRGILHRGGSILGCSNRANPFAYPTRDAQGQPQDVDMSTTVLERIKAYGFDGLVLVGGDGTMSHGKAMMKLGVPVIGVPKTIDNDLAATDFTFGFNTAVGTATWAIDTLHSTAESHDRVMIVELMGRYAGWIALHAGISGGADVIVLPELPYDEARIVERIQQRSRKGIQFSLVVVGEGARPKGESTATLTSGRAGHLERLGGAGQVLAERLRSHIDHEIRVTVLGHLQRGGSPSSFDRLLGSRFGVHAAQLCAEGKVGHMVALRGQSVVAVPIEEALAEPKRVDPQGDLCRMARALGIELGG